MDSLVVIARYLEDLSWTRLLTKKFIVYNKGEKNTSYINIENIGCEEFSYLTFIVDHYNNLPDNIIFTQGNPFPHSPDFLYLVNQKSSVFSDNQVLTHGWSIDVPGQGLCSQTNCLNIDQCKIHIDFFNGRYEKYNPILDTFAYYPPAGKGLYQIIRDYFDQDDIRLSIYDLLKLPIRDIDKKPMTPMGYCAIFSVSKEKILAYPIQYYEYLLEQNILAHNSQIPAISEFKQKVFGWIMEMMWLELFGYDPPDCIFKPKSRSELIGWWNNV